VAAEQTFHTVTSALLATSAVAYAVFFLLHALRRSRPGFAVGRAFAVGIAVRVTAVIGVALLAPDLFGPDEQTFLRDARTLNEQPIAQALGDMSPLHVWLFSLELRVLGMSETSMRIVQVGIAVAGLLLLAAAVYDLAGARAARLVSWLLVLEPSGVFFGGLLHKEALLTLGTGLVVFGASKFWRRNDAPAVVLLAAGCAIAIATRPYAGWVLTAASAALVVHRVVRPQADWRRASLLAAIIVAGVATLAVASQVSSEENLQRLQTSQAANTSDGSNLALEPVTYSTRADLLLNLPQRTLDFVLQPYPWQLASTNQRVGVFGTLTALATLVFLVVAAVANPRAIMRRATPFVYPALFLLAAYAMTSGNAGTSFRHRSQLVALGVCVVVILRAERRTYPRDVDPLPASSRPAGSVEGYR